MADQPREPAVIAYIGIGSNIEPRDKYIERAVNALQDHPRISGLVASSVYETRPVGGPKGQGDFLNAAVKIETDMTPLELLDVLQSIEDDLGRSRQQPWGPRTIDLDLLLYGEQIISDERLIVPHPLMHERRFVLQPLADIAPDTVHPILLMSIRTILESMGEDE